MSNSTTADNEHENENENTNITVFKVSNQPNGLQCQQRDRHGQN